MADNQMVKIEFDFDLGNVPASAKKFAEYLRGIETTSKETANQLKQLGDGIDRTSEKMTKSGNNIKKSNQQWTSFALVIQDLPYGFRGIQNNLPALIGGIAGAAGPIYLIASALIAFTTAYEKEIAAFIYGISAVDSAQQKLNVAISTGIGVAKAETATNAALLIVINDVTKSTTERKDALDLLKDKYKGNIELQKTDIDDGKQLIAITNKISEALLRRARAEAFSKLIAEEEAKIFKLQSEQGEQVVKNLGFLETSYEVLKSVGNGVTTSMNITTAAFAKQGKQISTAQGNIKLFTEKLNENTVAQIKNKDEATLDTGAAKNIAKEPKAKVPKYEEDLAKAKFNFYKDNLFQAEYYFNQLNDIEKLNALKEAVINKASNDELTKIEETYAQKSINFHQQIEDKKLAIRQASLKRGEQLTEADQKAKKKTLDTEFQNEMDSIQNKLSAQLKGNRKEPIQQAQNYKEAIAGYLLMSMEAGRTAEEIEKLQDKINNLNSSAEGTAAAFTPMADILNNLATNTLVEFGTQIGNLLSGGEFSLDGFLGMIASALIQIGTHLVMVSKLFLAVDALFASGGALAPLAIPIGLAAIAAGVALSSSISKKQDVKAFANGGIVSGPTMGLIGEYPGAKSNPEVVAPLDKLKDMIGGNGGGQFVLRGTDLVLALNRSEKSINLRNGA